MQLSQPMGTETPGANLRLRTRIAAEHQGHLAFGHLNVFAMVLVLVSTLRLIACTCESLNYSSAQRRSRQKRG
jgi:hypothetical protein